MKRFYLVPLMALLFAPPSRAQDPVGIDFSPPVRDTIRTRGIPDSVLSRAITQFNATGTTRITGNFDLAAGNVSSGTQALYRGQFRIDGRVDGDVLVVNGDVRVTAGGEIRGTVTVLGGQLLIDDGGTVMGGRIEYTGPAPLALGPDGRLVRQAIRRALTDYTSATATFSLGPFETTLHAEPGVYNRVEGFPIEFGPSFVWNRDRNTRLTLDMVGVVRTATDATDSRGTLGWRGSLAATRYGARPLTVRLLAGSVISATADQPYQQLESGLGAFFLRRDFRDWYADKSVGLAVEWLFRPTLRLSALVRQSRERSVNAVDAFSLLRGDEAWRPNPLVDDGKYLTFGGGAVLDTRDDPRRPTTGWFLRGDLRYVTSNELTPVSLPAEIRSVLPTTGYDALETEFDLRRYQRLGPEQSLHLRLAGAGWLAGNRLTIQRRRALNGGDPMSGYGFRALNCDRRRRSDPAIPALCDRQMVVQVEYRRTLDLNLSTRIGNTTFGLQRPDLVVFGDAGSAWLAGADAGRVPSDRIQSIAEWRSDIGVGIDAGSFGVYLAKALADPDPVRFGLRFSRRF